MIESPADYPEPKLENKESVITISRLLTNRSGALEEMDQPEEE